MNSTVLQDSLHTVQVTTGSCPTVQWIKQHCSCAYSAKPLVRLITTFACVILPERCVDFSIVVQHSYPNLLLLIVNEYTFLHSP